MATKETVKASDYVGIVSLKREPKKIEKSGLHPFKSNKVNAPMFEEYPLTLECEVAALDGDDQKGYTLVGNIINVSVDEKILTNGKVDVRKLEPITFDTINNKYIVLGDDIADAFKIGRELK